MRPLIAVLLTALSLAHGLTAASGASVPVDAQTVGVDATLLPAWRALTTLRTAEGQHVGASYLLIAEATGVGLTVGPLLAVHSSLVEPLPHQITYDIGDGQQDGRGAGASDASRPVRLRRFHGTVELNPLRISTQASQVAQEVVQHLAGLDHARVRVTLEIEADVKAGAPPEVVRTATENCQTLRFASHGFEEA